MKTALSKDVKLFKEAKECMQKCVREFISFITFITSEDGLKSIVRGLPRAGQIGVSFN